VDGAAQPLHRLPGERLGVPEPLVDLTVVGHLGPAPLDGHPGREHVLGHAVVQLAGDPVPLGVHRLPLRGDVQPPLGLGQLFVPLGEVAGAFLGLRVELLGPPAQPLRPRQQVFFHNSLLARNTRHPHNSNTCNACTEKRSILLPLFI
jgi:hypothetical protein